MALYACAFVYVHLPEYDPQWATLDFWGGKDGSRSGVVRNLGLLVLAVIGIVVAVWRSLVAQWQLEKTDAQLKLALERQIIDQKSELSGRLNDAAKLLAEEKKSARFSGIYLLSDVIQSDPNEFYIVGLDILSAFIREESSRLKQAGLPAINLDEARGIDDDLVSTAFERLCMIRSIVPEAEAIESRARNWSPDLRGMVLRRAELRDLRLWELILVGVNLDVVSFNRCRIDSLRIHSSTVSRLVLSDCQLSLRLFSSTVNRFSDARSKFNVFSCTETDFTDSRFRDSSFTENPFVRDSAFERGQLIGLSPSSIYLLWFQFSNTQIVTSNFGPSVPILLREHGRSGLGLWRYDNDASILPFEVEERRGLEDEGPKDAAGSPDASAANSSASRGSPKT